MTPRDVVAEILKKLENEGVCGYNAWFVGGWPHIVMQRRHDGGYEVLMWREGVKLRMKLDREFKVVDVSVYYE